jgi:hypothetical protein
MTQITHTPLNYQQILLQFGNFSAKNHIKLNMLSFKNTIKQLLQKNNLKFNRNKENMFLGKYHYWQIK